MNNQTGKAIAFDVDDTISSSLPIYVAKFNELIGKDKHLSMSEFAQALGNITKECNPLEVAYGVSRAEINQIMDDHHESWIAEMKPIQQGLATARDYAWDNNWIFYITARPSSNYDSTKNWLKLNGFPPGRILHYVDKVKAAKLVGIDTFYEDNIRNAISLHNAGIKTYLITSEANKGFTDLPEGLERLNWE